MKTKLTTPAQVALLRTGDTLTLFPSNGSAPQDVFDTTRPQHTALYEIQSINPATEMVSLVMARSSVPMFALAGEVGRCFLKSYNLVTEKCWWV